MSHALFISLSSHIFLLESVHGSAKMRHDVRWCAESGCVRGRVGYSSIETSFPAEDASTAMQQTDREGIQRLLGHKLARFSQGVKMTKLHQEVSKMCPKFKQGY